MASNRIKGITIEIGGNTTKLQASLKDVDKQLGKTKSALADVNKLLKMDPKNTELLQQKQKLLGDAINQTKERLEKLREAQKNVKPEDWDALQREIAATESDLKSLETEYKSLKTTASDALVSAGDKLKSLGDKMGKAGETLTKNVTLPIVAIGTAATKSAMEVDEGYDIIIKKTGKTGKEAEALQRQMDRVFTKLPTDAQTAGTAVGEVATRFDVTGDKVGDLAAEFVQFADITDQDVSSAIENTAKVMKQFGIESDKADEVMGALTTASQSTGVSMDTLYGALEKNGSTLKNMGLNLGKSVDLLAQFEANGVDSATAMTALRKAQQVATKDGKSLGTTLRSATTAIKNAKTNTEALQIATKVFGTKGAAPMAQAIREGRLSFDSLNGTMGQYKDTVKQTYEETQDPWDKMKVAMNNVKVAGAELGSQLMTVLAPIIEKIAKTVEKFTKWFQSLNKGQQELVVKIAMVAAALGPVLVIIGKVATGAGTVITTIGKVKTAISAGSGLISTITSLATTAAPFLIGGAIVAGVIAAGVLIYKNWDKIKKAAKALGKAVKAAWNGIKKSVSDAAGKAKDAAAKAWDGIKTKTSSAWSAIKSTVSTAASGVKTAASKAWDGVKTAATTAWNGVKTATSTAWTGIKSAVGTAATATKTAVSNGMKNISSTASKIWEKTKSITSNAWGRIKGAVTSGAGAMRNAAVTQLTRVGSAFSTTWSKAKNLVSGALSNIANSARTKFSNIKQSISSAFSGLRISDPFSNIKQKAYNAIQYIRRLFSYTISFPRIKLPHFSVYGRFSLNPPSVPRISVRWYKRAYENALMFNSPTVLQTPSGLKGFGDGNGGEIVYGHRQLMRDIAEAKGGDITVNVYGSDGMSVNQLADAVQRRLVTIQRQKEAAFA